MSIFHASVRDILEDVQRFLNCTLTSERLSAASIFHKESLLMKINHMRNEYPQLHLQIISQPNQGGAATITNDNVPSYTDMHGNPQPASEDKQEVDEEYYEVCNSADTDALTSIKSQQQPNDSSVAKSVLKCGFLEKKGKDRLGGLLNTVQRRWVTLQDGQLDVYTKQGDKRPCGHIPLQGYVAKYANFTTKDESKKNACFELVGLGLKTYQFVAMDNNDAKEWIDAISTTANNLENYESNTSQVYSEDSQGSSGDSVTGLLLSGQHSTEDYGDVYESLEDHEVSVKQVSTTNFIEEDLYHDTADDPVVIEEPPASVLPPQYRNFYLALWDYMSSAGDELNFKRGEMIKILSKEFDEHLWWIGELNGRSGLVPKSYLMEAYEICS
ncbi:Src kinase-associated phosphoprotein 2 [Chamberlinius hualienensis]